MKYHEENTTTIIKEVTKITTTKIGITITVKRTGTKTTRVPIRRKMTKRNPRTRMSTLSLTKDCCPAGFDENIFACTCRMIQEKVNSTRQSGIMDIKTVNAVEKDNFMHVFNFPEDVYDSAWAQATGEEDPGSSGNLSD